MISDQFVPPQKPMTDEEEEDYRNKMRHHFKQRNKIMENKYPFPHWCKWVVWILLITAVLILVFYQEQIYFFWGRFLVAMEIQEEKVCFGSSCWFPDILFYDD